MNVKRTTDFLLQQTPHYASW